MAELSKKTRWKIGIAIIVAFTLMAAFVSLCAYGFANYCGPECGHQDDGEAGPTVTLPLPTASTSSPRSKRHDVSGFDFLQTRIEGAMFEYELPTTEELLELGFYASGASPTHLAVIGDPV